MAPAGASLPYRDSTADKHRTAVLTERLAQDGYLLLRGLLPAAAVARVSRHVAAVSADVGWTDARGVSIRRSGAASASGSDAFLRMWAFEPLHRLMHHGALTGMIEDLLDERVLVHPIKVLRVVRPARSRSRRDIAGWHQDFPELQGSPRQLTVWTPLAPCDAESGALALIPGSHRAGLRALRLANNPSGWEALVDEAGVPVCGALEPGDALIFTTYTVHAGTSNESERFRISMDARYQPLADPICEKNLELAGFGFDWPDVYRDWMRDDLQYYWKRLDLDVAAHDRRWENWREDAAIAAARQGDVEARRALELAVERGRNGRIQQDAAAALRALARLEREALERRGPSNAASEAHRAGPLQNSRAASVDSQAVNRRLRGRR